MKKSPLPMCELKDELYPGKLHVLQALYRQKQASRTTLAKDTGLSLQSLSRIMQELLEAGLVSEVSRRRGGRGQPAIEMTLRPERLMTLGLVLQQGHIECLLGDLAGGVFRQTRRTGDFHTAAASLATATELVADMLADMPAKAALLGIGISQSGFFFQPGTRRVISRSDVQGWLTTDMAVALHARFGLPVFIENDGTAAAVGHLLGETGKRYRCFFVVLLTHGVGGGVIDNGRLVRGRLGNAGELAVLLPADPQAIRPTTESLEAWLAMHGRSALNIQHIEKALNDKDAVLGQWLDEAARVLSQGLRSVIALLDPEAVVLAGPLPESIRAQLAARLRFEGPRAGNITVPVPEVLIDSSSDCLHMGAQAMPVVDFFDHGRIYAPVQAGSRRRTIK